MVINTRFIWLPLFCVEELLNTAASAHQSARLQRMDIQADIVINTASTELCTPELVIINSDNISHTAGTAQVSTTSGNYTTDLLYTTFSSDEYGLTILTRKIADLKFVTATPQIISQAKLQASYKPPKGVVGIFASDEHLQEPAMRSWLGIIIHEGENPFPANDELIVHILAQLRYRMENRKISSRYGVEL
jgi:hypothetical protein